MLMLKNNVTWPVPMDKKYQFIPVELELKQNASRFRLRNAHYLPPPSLNYSTYKICARKMDDPMKEVELFRQKEMIVITKKVKGEIDEAKKILKEIMLSYQTMVIDNRKKMIASIEKLVEDIDTFKRLKKMYRGYVLAGHSLLYIKDSMEEAVKTYGEYDDFMNDALKEMKKKESIRDVQVRMQNLEKLKKEIANDAKQEIENQAVLVNQLIAKQDRCYQEASLLHIRGKELATALKDLDYRISTEQQFMHTAHSWNERAWKHYSFINFTLFDLMKYIIESRNLSPEILNMNLWHKMHFLRREHMCNLTILSRLGKPKQEYDPAKLTISDNTPYQRQKSEARCRKIKMESLKDMRKQFRGTVPRMYKLLFRKLRLRGKRSKKIGEEFLNMLRAPETNVEHKGAFALKTG